MLDSMAARLKVEGVSRGRCVTVEKIGKREGKIELLRFGKIGYSEVLLHFESSSLRKDDALRRTDRVAHAGGTKGEI